MAVLQLRRQATASPPPPTSAARQILAERVAADRAATQRQTDLGAILARARTEMQAAQDAVAAAEGVVARAEADAAAYATARLLGTAGAPPLSPSRARVSTCRLRKDPGAATAAASNAIEADLQRLGADARNRIYWISEACAAVMAEECPAAVAALLGGIDALSRALVEEGRALSWLVTSHVMREIGPNAFPGALEMTCRSTSPATMWSLWHSTDASPTEAKWEGALASLKADPSARVPLGARSAAYRQ